LHLRGTTPRKRKDDYKKTILNKFNFILNYCDEHGIDYLIQPGDFFESEFEPIDLLLDTFLLLKNHSVKVLVIYGQHDLYFHSKEKEYLKKTPLTFLSELGLVTILKNTRHFPINKNTKVWGCSWGSKIPDIKDYVAPENINILAIHKMITPTSKQLWPGMKNYTPAKTLLESTDFDLIVCGDNHSYFVEELEDSFGHPKHLVNCGSLGRITISQIDFQPLFKVYDTEYRNIQTVLVPIHKDVFKVEEEAILKDKQAELERLVEEIKTLSLRKKVSFKEIVLSNIKDSVRLLPFMEQIFQHVSNKRRK
jgi:hypothetical protein